MRQKCAVAYVLALEELRQQVTTNTLAATLAQAMGADAEIPDWPTTRAGFDAALAAEPRTVDPDEMTLSRALGLRR